MINATRFFAWLTSASCILVLSFQPMTAKEPPTGSASTSTAAQLPAPRVPRFSIDYLDTSVQPGADFYKYADGNWVRNNPVPPDKSRWGAFMELQERNWFLI